MKIEQISPTDIFVNDEHVNLIQLQEQADLRGLNLVEYVNYLSSTYVLLSEWLIEHLPHEGSLQD